MADITAIILTKNEAIHIAKCIASIQKLVDRIIVIDSYSDDDTVGIATKMGAEVYQHPFKNHSKQFIYGMNNFNITTQWIMRIDADESLANTTVDKIEELCSVNSKTDINGIIIRYEVNFMNKKLRHGGMYPFRKLAVFKKDYGRMEEANMDEHICLTEGCTAEITDDNHHDCYKDLSFFIEKHNGYATREVLDYVERRNQSLDLEGYTKQAKLKRMIKYNIYYKLPMGVRARLYYMYRYYIQLGFLDGKEGRIFAFLQAYWYRYLVDAKIYEYEQTNKRNY